MKILIAEDENMSRRFLQRTLEKIGHEVVATGNGREALRLVFEERFPILITDWSMPGMDGLELVQEIRNRQNSEYVYIIMITAKTSKTDLVQVIEAGADDYLTKPFHTDELRVRLLAGQRVIELEARLKEKNRSLRNANEKMKKDLHAAALIQASLLPTDPPAVENINVHWCFYPSDELAGDIFNVFSLDEDHIGLYLLDVSGHGVPAALLAVTLSRMLSPLIDESSLIKRRVSQAPFYQLTPPAEVATQLNRRFQLEPENSQYFTLIYGILNTKSREFRYASAGHPELVRITSNGSAQVLDASDIPIGILPGHEYQEHVLQLEEGDRIYLYSDGIVESESPDGQFFGIERMVDNLLTKLPLNQNLDALLTTVENWCHPNRFGDDVSILALEIAETSSTVVKDQSEEDHFAPVVNQGTV